MTVAPLALPSQPPRRGWLRFVPRSWVMMGVGDGRDRERDRDRDLDETASFRRRYDDNVPPQAPKVQVPFGVIITVVIYLIGQLAGSVWWAATLQSNLMHEMADRAKEEARLWDNIQTYRAEVNALRVDLARASGGRRSNDRQGDD